MERIERARKSGEQERSWSGRGKNTVEREQAGAGGHVSESGAVSRGYVTEGGVSGERKF